MVSIDPHVLCSYRFDSVSDETAPRVLVLGAVHGNETCGTQACERLLSELTAGTLRLARGSLTLVPMANPLAYQQATRMGERNLNRNFRKSDHPVDYEDRIANRLAPLLESHDVLLDLHSFHTGGTPFLMLGPENNPGPLERFERAAEEEAWARRVGPTRMVEGWLSTYAAGVARRMANPHADQRAQILSTDPGYGVGTTEFMRARGGVALTVECGQHADPQAPVVAYAAIRNTLAHFRLMEDPTPTAATQLEIIRLVEVIDRGHPDDAFEKTWQSFDVLARGERIGRRATGDVVEAPEAGYIVFPNPNALPGNEWFYRAERSSRAVDGVLSLPVDPATSGHRNG